MAQATSEVRNFVAENQEAIDKAFGVVSGQLFLFHEQLLTSQGTPRIEVTITQKMTLRNEWCDVAKHSTVAQAFFDKLKQWAAETLVPDYLKPLEEAFVTGNFDGFCETISRNFTCFSLITELTGAIFMGIGKLKSINNHSKGDTPAQVLFNAYREKISEKIRTKIQEFFFGRVAKLRSTGDAAKIAELQHIADAFMYEARTPAISRVHRTAVTDRDADDDDSQEARLRDCIKQYVARMVIDNKNAVKDQIAEEIPANEIAEWINRRAEFEQTLLNTVFSREMEVHADIMRVFDDKVVANWTKDLINDEKHGFAAFLRNGDKTVESFGAAMKLFRLAFRFESKQCVEECVREFRKAVTDRLKGLLAKVELPVYDTPVDHAKAFVNALLTELRTLDEIDAQMNHVRLNGVVSPLLEEFRNRQRNSASIWFDSLAIVRKVTRGTDSYDEKKLSFDDVLAVFVDAFLKIDEGDVTSVDADTFSNFVCFSLVGNRAAFIFSHKGDCERVENRAYENRKAICNNFHPQIQQLFFRRVSELRATSDQSTIAELGPIAKAFLNYYYYADDDDDQKACLRDCFDKYAARMVSDNKAAVKQQKDESVPANVIAEWINRRAEFERKLFACFFSYPCIRRPSVEALRSDIMKRYDAEVVAHFAEDLINDKNHGFAAFLRNGDVTAKSFVGAKELFLLASRIEKTHKDCVGECVREFQQLFLRPVSELRATGDEAKITVEVKLSPIADIFADCQDNIRSDFFDKYAERMVSDNKAAIEEQITQGVPAGLIAEWINRRAEFEQTLIHEFTKFGFGECREAEIMISKFDSDVAVFAKDLITDEKHGFAASFRNGGKTVESFVGAIELFRLAARIESTNNDCVEECVREFHEAVTDRLKGLLAKVESFDSPAKAFVNALLTELHIIDKVIQAMNNRNEFVAIVKAVLNSTDDSLKVKLGTSNDEKKIPFAEVLAVVVDAFMKSDKGFVGADTFSNFVCFSLVAEFAGCTHQNTNNELPEFGNDAPPRGLFNAYREQFPDEFRSQIQQLFLRQVSELRSTGVETNVAELRPISDAFLHEARTPATSRVHRSAVRTGRYADDDRDDHQEACLRDCIKQYVARMVSDNTTAVNDQKEKRVPASEIAEWINRRAEFEQTLLNTVFSREQEVHAEIMREYDAKVVVVFATFAKDLINDEKHGFAASFRNGGKTVESFGAAIELFRLAARIEKSHKNCLEECVREFSKAVTNRLKPILAEVQSRVYDTPVDHAKAFVNSLLPELHIIDKIIEKMNNRSDLVASVKAVLNSSDDSLAIVRKVKRGTGNDEKKILFAEVLAVFVDTFLKSDDAAAASVDAATETVNDIGTLFRFVQDKDIFGEHYKLRLSKRLLLTKYNEDTELQILVKMQKQCGPLFIHKFEGMINDLRVANAIQQTFDDANIAMPAVFGIKILTFTFWPQIKPDETFVFPDSLQQCQDTFTRHYRAKNPTRLLRWQAERGSAIVDINYPKGPKEVSMNMHQAAVIIAIDADSARPDGVRPLSVLSTVTGIEVSEIKPLVASMLLAKGLQLVRVKGSGLNPKFTESDVIEMNPDYTINMSKIKLSTAATARTAASETVTEETNNVYRGQVLDAAIVRIMKSRKEMKHQDIVESTIQAVLKFFHPQPRQIKLRIERLIEQKFLERDENETDVYRYLA